MAAEYEDMVAHLQQRLAEEVAKRQRSEVAYLNQYLAIFGLHDPACALADAEMKSAGIVARLHKAPVDVS